MVYGRIAGSPFRGNLAVLFEDLRKVVPGVQYDFRELGEARLLGKFESATRTVVFKKGKPVGVVTLADELQHALDYARTGFSEEQIAAQIAARGLGPNAAYSWYHRRIFTRAIKNINNGIPGFSQLKGYIGEVYDAYLDHGGTLTMKQIIETRFDGLF